MSAATAEVLPCLSTEVDSIAETAARQDDRPDFGEASFVSSFPSSSAPRGASFVLSFLRRAHRGGQASTRRRSTALPAT